MRSTWMVFLPSATWESSANWAGERNLAEAASLARSMCSEAYMRIADESLHVHGGIGFTWEHEAHRYLKRAKTSQLLHGTPAELRRLVSQRAGLC